MVAWQQVPRPRHPQKDIDKALAYAATRGWIITEVHRSHRWGKIECGSGCYRPVPSTPANPTTTAKQLRRAVDKCEH